MFPFAKSYLDGLISACLSLEGILVWVSVSAVSQEVPLRTWNTEWDCTIEGQCPKLLRTNPRPPSWFSILIVVAMATLNSQYLVDCVMLGGGLNAACWCDMKTPSVITTEHYHWFISEALSVYLTNWTGRRNHCLLGCKDLTEILCCWKQMITGDFQMVCLVKKGLSEIKGSILLWYSHRTISIHIP